MKTVYEKMQEYLEDEPRARERAFKDNGIRKLLVTKHPELANVTKATLLQVFKDYTTYDRAWRKVLEENPKLRGSDYDEKQALAMKKMDELGYRVQPNDYTNLKDIRI